MEDESLSHTGIHRAKKDYLYHQQKRVKGCMLSDYRMGFPAKVPQLVCFKCPGNFERQKQTNYVPDKRSERLRNGSSQFQACPSHLRICHNLLYCSLQASSPIWASEANRKRTRE